MAVLLVTYDLKKPGQDYTDFLKLIRQYPYARLSESSYAVETNETPVQVYNKLIPHMDKNDQIYVVTLRSPYWGLGPQDVNNWMSQRLT